MNNLNQSPPPPPKKKKLRILYTIIGPSKKMPILKWLLQALIHSLMKTNLKNQSIQYTLNTVLYLQFYHSNYSTFQFFVFFKD